jgi:hypothetical protein
MQSKNLIMNIFFVETCVQTSYQLLRRIDSASWSQTEISPPREGQAPVHTMLSKVFLPWPSREIDGWLTQVASAIYRPGSSSRMSRRLRCTCVIAAVLITLDYELRVLTDLLVFNNRHGAHQRTRTSLTENMNFGCHSDDFWQQRFDVSWFHQKKKQTRDLLCHVQNTWQQNTLSNLISPISRWLDQHLISYGLNFPQFGHSKLDWCRFYFLAFDSWKMKMSAIERTPRTVSDRLTLW